MVASWDSRLCFLGGTGLKSALGSSPRGDDDRQELAALGLESGLWNFPEREPSSLTSSSQNVTSIAFFNDNAQFGDEFPPRACTADGAIVGRRPTWPPESAAGQGYRAFDRGRDGPGQTDDSHGEELGTRPSSLQSTRHPRPNEESRGKDDNRHYRYCLNSNHGNACSIDPTRPAIASPQSRNQQSSN